MCFKHFILWIAPSCRSEVTTERLYKMAVFLLWSRAQKIDIDEFMC